MSQLFISPFIPAFGVTGILSPSAKLYFYLTGTTTDAAVYTTSDLETPHAQPVVANTGGAFAPIYLDPSVTYRVVLKTAAGATIGDVDPFTANSAADFSFTQSGTGAVARTVQDKFRRDVLMTPFDYGAAGSGAAGDPTALAAMLAAINADAELRATGLNINRPYTFPSTGGPYDLGGGYVTATPSGSLAGAIYLGSERRYQARIPVAYNDGTAYYDYTLGRKFGRQMEERERPMDAVADAGLKLEATDFTATETSRWPSDATDVWTAETPTTKTAATVAYTITADSNWHVTWVPVQGGMDVSAYINGAVSGSTFGMFVRTTKGMEYFYATAGLAGAFAVKLAGVTPSVTTGVTWLGQGTYDSYAIHKSLLTIRAYQGRRYGIMLNGTEIFPPRDLIAPGEIVAVGFGVFGVAPATISIVNPTRRTTREPTGSTPLHIFIAGNSISDAAVHGTWDLWMRETLDGAMGMKVLSVNNDAVSGANSAAIAGQITGTLGPANVCCIVAPEVNDIQSGAAASVTVGNIGGMIDTLITAGVKPILITGYLWYSRALAGGSGQNTTNYAEGAETRSAMRRLAATKGVPFFDLSETTGPVLAAYLADATNTDPIVRDAIHPTAWYYRRIGEWVAKAVLRAFRPKMTPFVADATFPTGAYTWMANSWTTSDATYSVTSTGFPSASVYQTSGLMPFWPAMPAHAWTIF